MPALKTVRCLVKWMCFIPGYIERTEFFMNRDIFNLEGQTAVVIGGTGVLGGAMAAALAGFGARVAIVGRHAERGADRVREIESNGGTAIFQSADALVRESLLAAR